MRLAELLHVSYASINRWENDQSKPNRLAWRQIARAENEGLDAFGKPATHDLPPGVDVAAEEQAGYSRGAQPPPIDFSSSPETVRAVIEAERLTYGHLFNPSFATEISMIDPLPHQRIAVYEHMLPQQRLRFLLADDAGAGKTIMAGLYIREMLSRRLIRRVLIVPPAGLVGNWRREMHKLFSLPFRIASGADARAGNPFTDADSNLVIVSVDTLRSGLTFERLGEPRVEPYDLVIFDEAHKLSADRTPDLVVQKRGRYRLAEALAGASVDPEWLLPWHTRHVLLLTATPHMGKDYPYFALWRLLEPEVLSTIDAFNAFPQEDRAQHFLRRTKEEMVRFDGTPIYLTRESSTLSYDLTKAEQDLYDRTTAYIEAQYNQARILNRSAAKLAMSIFQRRLASCTFALLRSFERRLDKLDALIEDLRTGRLTDEQLAARQRQLDVHDVLDEMTGDEEESHEGFEENEAAESAAFDGVAARSLPELEAERILVNDLLDLARKVYEAGEESKFEKLREILRDDKLRGEKIIIFTEHRDTLLFLVRRLEGLGHAGRIALIHGGMDYIEREQQVEQFRHPADEGGATYMVATDAAGEGINLQFCWLMVCYDVPWNPARLEQRFGRIHRYGQSHDPVLLFNLVAGATREGRVLRTLLQKLESIRKELGSDKVFDIIGRQFEGVSLKDLIVQATVEGPIDESLRRIEGMLTPEQAKARIAQMEKLLGTGGDVSVRLPEQRAKLEREELRRLLPGYVRSFIEQTAPLLGIAIEGDLDLQFALRPLVPGAIDPLLPVLETYDLEQRERLSVYKPAKGEKAIFLHPGEVLFDEYRALVCRRFGVHALRGGVFVDPYAAKPYFLHLVIVSTSRNADPEMPEDFPLAEPLEYRLANLRDDGDGIVTQQPVEHLMILRGATEAASRTPVGAALRTYEQAPRPSAAGVSFEHAGFGSTAAASREACLAFARDRIAGPMAEQRRRALLDTLEERIQSLARGYAYHEAELAAARSRLSDRARNGDPKARIELAKVKQSQRELQARRDRSIAAMRREPELIAANDITFIAHALVVPSADPEDRKRHDREVEKIAVRVSVAYEQARGCSVRDVSTPELARAAGLGEWVGFDLHSRHAQGEERCIEVNGRAQIGDVELSETEWAKACNLRVRYWLYVVFECASAYPRLLRVQDPFGKLLAKQKGGVVIDEQAVFDVAEDKA